MDIRGKNLLVIGGAGLIGSHTVDKLLEKDVGSITIYDNFTRGREENLVNAFKDHVLVCTRLAAIFCRQTSLMLQ